MPDAPPLPAYVQIEPVGQCNLRCQMCPIQFRTDGPPHGPPAFMAFDTFTGLVDQFDGALRELHLQGLGEPMMHPRFFEMVRYATARQITVSTNSNLTLLTPSRAEECVASGLEWLHVSIDGASAELYERIRVRSRLERVLTNVEHLLAARRRAASDRPRLRMVSVVMRQNLHELPDLVRLARRYEFESLFVQHLCHDFGESSLPAHYRPMRQFVQEQTLLEERLDRVNQYFGEARAVAAELRVDLRLPAPRAREHDAATPGRERCSWPWTGGYVSYQGLAMPCCMIATPDRLNFGSVKDDGLVSVWNSTEYQAFRSALASPTPPEICRSCSVYNRTF